MPDDIAFMQQPEKWPNWPILPLVHKRRAWHDDRRAGIIFDGTGPKVFIGNMFGDLSKISEWPVEEYFSFEALARDWRVD